MKDILFILKAPFRDEGRSWYCHDCATLEGALLCNPGWNETLDVRRIDFQRPRAEVVELVGEEYQGVPMLVMDPAGAPDNAQRIGSYAVIKDPRQIAWAIVARHGGVGPHP